ncbi:MAG: pyridoxine 5'-phosphate synthase [Verrucomicrobia bacterium]|nr:pyridoxine 5'-phosphate synthase [Verrucomicrobiota bacterium]
MKLGVNIDHVATLRQARYAGGIDAHNAEPDVSAAAAICERAGASGITIHLRADRRHIQDADVFRLREQLTTKMNLEMGNTPEIIEIALRVKPAEVCLVPEHRREVTTEGGLDVAGQFDALKLTVVRLQSAGIRVSMFIEPARAQIEASHRLGAEIVELHTGAFANATGEAQRTELVRIHEASVFGHGLGVQVNAGHGINYTNIALIRTVPHLAELNIGHSIVARAVFSGLDAAVRDMLAAMKI